MNLFLSSSGSYPRIGDAPEMQILRRTIAAADRGEKSSADLAEAENAMTRRAIEDQVKAGVEQLTDGQIRWHDPISHIPGKLTGVKIAGLLRFFDTNTYFRQPLLLARPSRKAGAPSFLAEEYRFARNALGSISTPHERAGRLAVKPVITGPYTLAKFSLSGDGAMNSLAARAEAYAEALEFELRALRDLGAELVQVDEPAAIRHPEDWAVFEAALQILARVREPQPKTGKRLQLALHVYFNNPEPLYEKLHQLPVDVLGLDFTYGGRLAERIAADGSPLPLALGLVDGRNTRLEDPGAVARQVEMMLPKIAGGRAYLCPSCGLEYLPRDRALSKLELLGRIREAVNK